MPEPPRILLVEDNPTDVWMIRQALVEEGLAAQLDVLADGEQALGYIEKYQAETIRPALDLLVLDLNLPHYSGHHVMRQWRGSLLSPVPIVVVSSSDSPRDLKAVQQLTPYYFRKPLDFAEFLKIGGLIRRILSSCVAQI